MTTGEANSAVAPKPSGKPLPKWAVGLASVSATMIILLGAGGVFGITWLQKISLDAVDPAYIAATVKRIADFPIDPKTGVDGYVPYCAVGLLGLDGVNFSLGKGKQQLTIFSYSSPESDPDPREAIDFWYDKPGMFPATGTRFASIADKGKADVNGHEFHYQTGQLREAEPLSHTGPAEVYKSLIGCLVKGRKILVVEAYAPPGQPLDIDSVTAFLRKGQSF